MRILPAIFALLCCSALPIQSQKIDVHLLKGMKIRSIGPAGMSGRVTSIDAVHSRPAEIYIGTASGGLWKSQSGGMKWKPVFDKQPVQSIGAVAVDQKNPDIIWAGTGEGNPRNSHNSGKGIYRSPDGGRSWQLMGLEKTRTIHRIIVHPDNSDIVFVGASGSVWGPNPQRGVFRTLNGGKTWEKVLYINDSTGCADLIIDPSNPDKLFAAMWEYGRQPWSFNSGGKGSGLYMSLDGGKNWKRLNEKHGLPKGQIGRIGLAISRSRQNVVYALVESKKTALYRSDNGGYKWHKQADKNIGNRPFYYADIFVDPQNENRLYNLHSIVTKSEDGGKTFEQLLPWSAGVHPDHHAFWIHPTDPNFLIDGNDGGMAISRNRGLTWEFVTNLPLAQFYHINVDDQIPYRVMGGMQDNGSWVGPSEVWGAGGIRNHHWREIAFGDGFDVMALPGDPETFYAMSQGGYVSRIGYETGESVFIRPVAQDDTPLRFNWNAAIAQDPFDACTIYFGSQFVHKSTDCGDSWARISPDLTTNDTTKQKQAESGGLTIDATQAENYTTILAIAPSPLQKGLIWAGTDDGKLQLSTNGGASWDNLAARLPGAPKGGWIPQIEVSRHTPGEVFVTLNDYRRNNWEPYAFHSRDYGKTWRRIADSKRVSGYVISIKQDPVVERLLFMGTDHGLYFSLDYGDTWNKWTERFPSVPTRDIKVHPREHDLVVATFGRAAWILDDITPLRKLAEEGPKLLEKELVLFPVTDCYNVEWRSVDESRFRGQAAYQGQNARRGALISVWLKPQEAQKKDDATPNTLSRRSSKKGNASAPPPKTKAEDKIPKVKNAAKKPEKKDKLHVTILNIAGDTIRIFETGIDTGLVRFTWGFERNGYYSPSYRDRPKNGRVPRGPRVGPGTYHLHVAYKDNKDSTTFKVLPDPRITVSDADRQEREDAISEYYKYARAGTDGFEHLKAAKKMIEQADGLLKNLDESLRDSLTKEGKAMKDSIKAMMEIFLQPENFSGINSVTKRLGSQYWEVLNYLTSGHGRPGANAMTALNRFKTDIRKAVARMNRFLEREWKAYRKKVENAKPPVFKDVEPVKIGE